MKRSIFAALWRAFQAFLAMETPAMTWAEFLEDYQRGRLPLFSQTFMQRWADEPWEPNDDDRKAAGKLHIQLTSRITTQRLGYLEGVEQTALKSLYALFQSARDIADEFPSCRHFEALAWDVLNTHVRPFTAKWHRESDRGLLAALDATDEFRAQLNDLQPLLRRFDDLLMHLRDKKPPPLAIELASGRETTIAREMNGDLPWGILPHYSGITPTMAGEINSSEREAILGRRKHYQIENKVHAIGLALSGGGIRSATFSLGVLVALAKRGVLPQIDYLSTVSGGGYLGSFLSAFLNSTGSESIGLRSDQSPFLREWSEAAALRHIRHHSKYLATGSAWQQLKMICAQLLGMVLNGLAIALVVTFAVVSERLLRSLGLEHLPRIVTEGSFGALALGMFAALLGSRFSGKWQRYADTLVAFLALPLLLLLAWNGLAQAHAWWGQEQSWSLWGKKTWLIIAGAIPLITSALSGIIGRFLLRRAGIFLVLLSAIAAPVFLLGIYLGIYAWGDSTKVAFPVVGTVTHFGVEVLVVVVGWLVYFFLLDINFTSPHRHLSGQTRAGVPHSAQ